MTFAPPSLLAVRAYLKPLTGLSSVELGITGDPAHAVKGTSYHLGKDQLTDDAYSRRTARDRAGLSNAASALDIGMFARLREMSIWLVAQCRAGAPDTRDIREVIYSPDGRVVWRWDREWGVTSQPRTGEADSSHLTHTHVSWYRDSEFRDRTAVFRRFFEGDDVNLTDKLTLPADLMKAAGSAQSTATVGGALAYTLARSLLHDQALARLEAAVARLEAKPTADVNEQELAAALAPLLPDGVDAAELAAVVRAELDKTRLGSA